MKKSRKVKKQKTGKDHMFYLIFVIAFLLCFAVLFSNFKLLVFQGQDIIEDIDNDVNLTRVDNVLGYIAYDEQIIEKGFSEKELIHLKDVKDVFWWIFLILDIFLIITAILIVILFMIDDRIFLQNTGKAFMISGILGSIIIISLLLMIFSFSFSFTLMHKILFIDTSWIFPEGSLITSLFPLRYFRNFLFKLTINSFFSYIFLFVSGMFGYYLERKS